MSASRRQLIAAGVAAAGLAPLAAWLTAPSPTAEAAMFPLRKTDEEWQAQLTSDQYDVLRDHGTERAFSSPLDREKRRGTFTCAGCGQPVFASAAKFDSGTGWPSFWTPLEGAVGTQVDSSWFMVRTEVHCAKCGGHLGHVFSDGPPPTGLRYCINGVALNFHPEG
jgi:peptide-methionine (R)-S-oxide reductase